MTVLQADWQSTLIRLSLATVLGALISLEQYLDLAKN